MRHSELRVSLPALGAGFAPIHYAYEKGLFEQRGVDVRVVMMEGGPACACSLLAGETHLTYALGPLIRGAMRGESADFRAISGLSKKTGFDIVGRAHLTSINDLIGKQIESPQSDWSGGTYLRYVLRLLGLENHIELAFNYVTQEQRLEGLLHEECDAGLLAGEKSLVAQERGLKVLLSLDEALPGVVSTAVLTTPNLIRERREDLKRALTAIKEGLRELQERAAESIAYLSGRFSLSPTVASSYHKAHAGDWSIALDPASVQREIDICGAVTGLSGLRADDIVDLSLLREIE